jgi:1-acyl-sn-glycerol-3-phosphate acyltransferase
MSWRYRYRVEGAHLVPKTGALIFIGNHQSYLDPVIHGLAVSDRPSRPIAKEELFRNPIFGAVLRAVGTIPVRPERGNRDAFRAALAELEAGRTVMIYPEGGRSMDGSVQPFQRGVELLARKSGAAIVPMGIDGAYDIWSPHASLPTWNGRIWAAIGTPIDSAQQAILFQDVEAGLEELRSRVRALMLRCRSQLRARSDGAFPAHGVADHGT